MKPRYITITKQRPKPQVAVRYPAHLSDDNAASAIPEVQEPVSPSAVTPTTLAKSPPASNNQNAATPKNNPDVGKIRTPADLTPMLTRCIKSYFTLPDICGLFDATKTFSVQFHMNTFDILVLKPS